MAHLYENYIPKVTLYVRIITAVTYAEECRDVDDCTHVECPEDDYELECVRESCTCTHGEVILIIVLRMYMSKYCKALYNMLTIFYYSLRK